MTEQPNHDIQVAGPEDRVHLVALEAILKSREEPDFADLLFQAIAQGQRSLILGFIGGKPAGYVIVNWQPTYSLFARLGIPELQDLNVLPDFRRNGLGEALVRKCEEVVLQRSLSEIGLGVGLDRNYGSAQRLYARMRFVPDGYGVVYDGEPIKPGENRRVDDDLRLMMVKDLRS